MSMLDNIELDFVTACNHLQSAIQEFMDKAERLAYAAGQQTELKLKDPDTNQPLKSLKKKQDRNTALAYQKLFTDTANLLREVIKRCESVSQLNSEVDKIYKSLERRLIILEGLYKPIPITEVRLFLGGSIEAIPTPAPMVSSLKAQLRTDLWGKDSNGIAFFQHNTTNTTKNYIEHYISNPGDISLLPWDEAQQIIDKFGFTSAKLHIIFAAHTMNQEKPWESRFSLKASDIVKEMGWDTNHKKSKTEKLLEIANTAFALDCLLVKTVWIEGRNKKGGVDASTPTGRMWNVIVDPRGQLNLESKIEEPTEIYLTIQPGGWTQHFLNKAGNKSKEALYQFGYLSQHVLKIDAHHEELALRLAIHLTIESRFHPSGRYHVGSLLEAILPKTLIDSARSDFRRAYDLSQRWDSALKLLLSLGWQVHFDEATYPTWLQPGGSNVRKPNGYLDKLLVAKITILQPPPIPALLASKTEPKRVKPTKAAPLTADQIRKARKAKGWTLRKLGGTLGVHHSLVGHWEKGTRTPSTDMEAQIKKVLDIQD